ncbi:Methyltransferase-like protein [Zostera marina]|uniref:Methyltransferase-like protein n=1 Tax=Zostera marina TaxID=29655 RepID=A0A0K9P0A6_ZOSMR|nr:Methyltransferase-like protein [Zostera marina]
MTIGSSLQDYGEPSYWNDRYRQDPRPFEWYQKYNALSPILNIYFKRFDRLLVVGCGNSVFGENMVADGYQDIYNIDISSVVIEAMKKKYSIEPAQKFVQMDVRDMSSFRDDSFDGVIDKGTLDSIMCGSNAKENAKKMLKEVGRILKDSGVYILITYGDPTSRFYLLKEQKSWNINLHVIERIETQLDKPRWDLIKPVPMKKDGSFDSLSILGKNAEVHYIYVCTKGGPDGVDEFGSPTLSISI